MAPDYPLPTTSIRWRVSPLAVWVRIHLKLIGGLKKARQFKRSRDVENRTMTLKKSSTYKKWALMLIILMDSKRSKRWQTVWGQR